jgi:hypothetical protein
LIADQHVTARVEMIETQATSPAANVTSSAWPSWSTRPTQPTVADDSTAGNAGNVIGKPRRLLDVAIGRSGDKGTGANIGIIARRHEDYAWLATWLTAQRVMEYFREVGVESVERFELPNLDAMNFVVSGILRRGLRNDAQGKALAQALLAMPLDESYPAVSS